MFKILVVIMILMPNFTYSSALVVRSKRVQALELSGLKNEVSSWDELEKDLLVMRAKHQSTKTLTEKYPNLPSEKLEMLQSLLKEGGGK